MANLPSDVLQDFSDMVIGEEVKEKQNTIYGTIVEKNENFYVKIDGSEELTPVNASVEIEDGDRVLLRIEGREVTAIGNITAPASARTATNYMKLTKDGLMVGNLGPDGKPDGSYTLMKGDAFQIIAEDVNGNNRVLAEFTANAVNFGNKASFTENGVILRDGSGKEIASFKGDGINFDGRASFSTDGIKMYDKSGNEIAKFSENGVTLTDGNGNILASFDGTSIKLGAEDSAIMLGLNSSGVPILQIAKDSISTGEKSMTLVSRSHASIWAKKSDQTYVYMQCFIDEESGKPKFQIWGEYKGETEWQMNLNQNGVTFSSKYSIFKFNGHEVGVVGVNTYSANEIDNKIAALKSYVNNLHNILEN